MWNSQTASYISTGRLSIPLPNFEFDLVPEVSRPATIVRRLWSTAPWVNADLGVLAIPSHEDTRSPQQQVRNTPPPPTSAPLAPHLPCRCIVQGPASIHWASLRAIVTGLVTWNLPSSYVDWALPWGPRPPPNPESAMPSPMDAIRLDVKKALYTSEDDIAFFAFSKRLLEKGTVTQKQYDQHYLEIAQLFQEWRTEVQAKDSEHNQQLPMSSPAPASLPPQTEPYKTLPSSSPEDVRTVAAAETVKEAVAAIIPDVSHNSSSLPMTFCG